MIDDNDMTICYVSSQIRREEGVSDYHFQGCDPCRITLRSFRGFHLFKHRCNEACPIRNSNFFYHYEDLDIGS